jgi:integrase
VSVTQLKDGRWLCRYPKGKNTAKPNSTKKYFGRGREGEQKAIAFNVALGLGEKATMQGVTFTELANDYLRAKEATLAPSTFSDTCRRLEKILLPYFGKDIAQTISQKQLDAYVSERNMVVTLAMIRNDLTILRAILNWSVKRRLISFNPMSGYSLPKANYVSLFPPSKVEIDAICACASPHLRRAVLLSYYTGLRPGKEVGRKWEGRGRYSPY